ncbi:hypothetical protein PFFVO_04478 [Plasmodium falciparum Vietnam Oak-Knoll (FVO)]|uniref:Uncharacterized protein n=1 Tax=Plasmodium falciparum Vietnam Oak-Knoll (FVO) TaxID=1036723 RepID=A0A024V0U8_PLAFA|nr:hypothetical protein PFFVO_04478 [Plasmodium falciparum Vietnam Oak-Knoll (FVO)]
MADNNNNYNNNINMDRLSEIFKSTLSLMKNTVHGLAQSYFVFDIYAILICVRQLRFVLRSHIFCLCSYY